MSLRNRTVRCLLVGEDLDLPTACFSLPIDEDHTTVQELQARVLERLPEEHRERLGSGVQLFKGFDLYVDHSQRVPSQQSPAEALETTQSNATFATPQKPTRRRSLSPSDAAISALLHQATSTPDNKVAGRYFQRKYAMRQRDTVAPYLARGRKCASSRIDVLVSAPKLQFSGDLATMEQEDEHQQQETELVDRRESIDYANSETGSFDYASPTDISFFDDNDTVAFSTPTKPLRRDPVVMDALRNSNRSGSPLMQTPSKWQRAKCGRVVSVSTLRLRRLCTRCCSMH